MDGWSRPYRERVNSLQLKKDRLVAGPLWRPRSGSDNRVCYSLPVPEFPFSAYFVGVFSRRFVSLSRLIPSYLDPSGGNSGGKLSERPWLR
jgi:hypothetical protein